MNKNYDWNETNTSVTIIFPLLYKIDKKKIRLHDNRFLYKIKFISNEAISFY